jgi:hypothetical protein
VPVEVDSLAMPRSRRTVLRLRCGACAVGGEPQLSGSNFGVLPEAQELPDSMRCVEIFGRNLADDPSLMQQNVKFIRKLAASVFVPDGRDDLRSALGRTPRRCLRGYLPH